MTPALPAAVEAAAPKPPTEPPPSRLRSALLVSAWTLVSRILGLVREQLFAALMGAGLLADAFVVAFRIPNLLRDLFAEGALSAAFVPTFAQVEKEQGPEAAYRLGNRLVGLLMVIIGALLTLGIAFAPFIVSLLAPGYEEVPGKMELTAQLTRVMFPFLMLVSLAAVSMGMLNAQGKFGAPALAPAFFNIGAIVVGGLLWLFKASPENAVLGWSIGTLLGGLLQLLVQTPALRQAGYRFRPRLAGALKDPGVRRMGRLMAPATMGLAATQLNLFVNTQFASHQPGANSWLNYAFRLIHLPIGIFGVAIGTVTATGLAQAAARKDLAGMKKGLHQGLRHVAFLTLPATVGLVVLAQPIIGLIYQHGRFTAADTRATAVAIAAYSIGLYAYSAVKVVAPAFYALDRARLPLVASVSAVAANIVWNALTFSRFGYASLAVGTSASALVNLAVLAVAFRRHTRSVRTDSGVFDQLWRVLLACAVVGLVANGADWLCIRALGNATLTARLLEVGASVSLGILAYGAACRLLGVREIDELFGLLRRRFGGRSAEPKTAL